LLLMPMAHLPLTYFLLPVSRRLRLAALLLSSPDADWDGTLGPRTKTPRTKAKRAPQDTGGNDSTTGSSVRRAGGGGVVCVFR
jgi:hypothetical protein